jgi:hypothetical protein
MSQGRRGGGKGRKKRGSRGGSHVTHEDLLRFRASIDNLIGDVPPTQYEAVALRTLKLVKLRPGEVWLEAPASVQSWLRTTGDGAELAMSLEDTFGRPLKIELVSPETPITHLVVTDTLQLHESVTTVVQRPVNTPEQIIAGMAATGITLQFNDKLIRGDLFRSDAKRLGLSEEEQHVALLAMLGYSPEQIAPALRLPEIAVSERLVSVYDKTGRLSPDELESVLRLNA